MTRSARAQSSRVHRTPAAAIRTTLALLVAVALAAPAAAAPAVTGSVTTRAGALDRTELTITDGAGPIDRYKAVRIVRHDGPVRPEVLLLLPPLGVNQGFYEQTDPHGGAATSIAGFFALRGYDVWLLVSRMEGIPAGTCEAGAVDCSAMAGWSLQRFVDDAAFVRGLAEAANPGAAVYTGGASLGGILALAVVDDAPASYAGAIVWEGALYTPDPAIQALNQAYCAQVQALLAGGVLFDGVGGNVLQQLVRQAELAPGGLTPVPLFPPFLTNMQALVGFFAAPPPGPVTMPVPGYYFLAGDPVAGTFRYASTERVITDVERFVAYSPFALVRDVSCSLAGLDTTHVDNLGAFTGKVLAIGGGGGFGTILADNLALFTSASSVDLLLEPDFGHIDHFMTPEHQRYVERPILRWIRGQTP